ncbi:hypothetical protein D9613_004389 [Agrocybe pediades]|uniref:F-box domain-containing protein n=1 Tax=Agrocybe pediades TaxID=84607 RepID=A0A8H4VLD7_9AGAR|nr:hypothetical protein D9613_004389 [Agrocybe pediades]
MTPRGKYLLKVDWIASSYVPVLKVEMRHENSHSVSHLVAFVLAINVRGEKLRRPFWIGYFGGKLVAKESRSMAGHQKLSSFVMSPTILAKQHVQPRVLASTCYLSAYPTVLMPAPTQPLSSSSNGPQPISSYSSYHFVRYEMWEDIRKKIYALLDPIDLISLSRTAKRFYDHIMGDELLWGKKLADLQEDGFPTSLPAYFRHIKPSDYIKLVLETSCHFCAGQGKSRYDWIALVRVCETCFRRSRKYLKWNSILAGFLSSNVRCAQSTIALFEEEFALRGCRGGSALYNVKVVTAWCTAMVTSTRPNDDASFERWEARTKKVLQEMKNHGRACEIWLKDHEKRKKEAKARLRRSESVGTWPGYRRSFRTKTITRGTCGTERANGVNKFESAVVRR